MLIVSKDLKSIIMSSVNKGSILVSFSLLNMGHISFMGAIADYGVLNPNPTLTITLSVTLSLILTVA